MAQRTITFGKLLVIMGLVFLFGLTLGKASDPLLQVSFTLKHK